MRFSMRALAALAVAVGVTFSAPDGHAQESNAETAQETTAVAPMRIANGTRFDRWIVSCEALAVNETACVLTQRLVRTSDNVFLTELLAFWSGDTERSFLAARVPNGVYFPAGFALKPTESDERLDFVWQSCGREICEALVEVTIEQLEQLEAAGDLIAGYRPGLVAEPVVFRLSVAGAAEGLKALKASLAGQAQ